MPLYLLAPKALASVGSKDNVGAVKGYHALPVAIRLICLSRNKLDYMYAGLPFEDENSKIHIGDIIPQMRMMTIELKYEPSVMKNHNTRFVGKMFAAKKRFNNRNNKPDDIQDEGMGGLDWKALRRLFCLSFSPLLDKFVDKAHDADTQSKHISDWAEQDDCGPRGTWHVSVKLCYLVQIKDQEHFFDSPSSNKQPPGILIFAMWLLVLWMTEMFIDMLGLLYVAIRPTMTPSQWSLAADEFNDPKSDARILLCTYGCGTAGLNLHESCSVEVQMEEARNMNTEIQSASRLNRIGQRKPQKVYILYQHATISTYVRDVDFRKAKVQVSAALRPELQP
ncbi:hypothetical protein BDV23DRAFT_181287 [Aspergillus alliaceus]|uniref:P-loop containing nucleoside triphosphate hydrolase protein n=1 Tax=Petromyces alliaceus TaxID=209559 RepID=A0A5N7CFB5_PETAA|nr:hypothetical protein BDV23DRAFT_181287 [Aspergillus alliaceus]